MIFGVENNAVNPMINHDSYHPQYHKIFIGGKNHLQMGSLLVV